MLKAQIARGGRGKARLVRFADNALCRHPEWADQIADRKGTALERMKPD